MFNVYFNLFNERAQWSNNRLLAMFNVSGEDQPAGMLKSLRSIPVGLNAIL